MEGREEKENGDRPLTIFGLNVALLSLTVRKWPQSPARRSGERYELFQRDPRRSAGSLGIFSTFSAKEMCLVVATILVPFVATKMSI